MQLRTHQRKNGNKVYFMDYRLAIRVAKRSPKEAQQVADLPWAKLVRDNQLGDYLDDFWRPITTINLGDTDGNPDTEVNRFWTPLLTTLRFPDYRSGHSTFSGCAAEILSSIFGPARGFSGSSDVLMENYGISAFDREFENFRAAASEASRSRVLGGIHFRSACEEGLISGRQIGIEVVSRELLPLPKAAWVLF